MGDQLPALIQEMLEPQFYGNEVTKNVTLIQTHISYVLLGDHFTYKIKKNIDLGFLDFRKLEDRKHFCEEEIRLNSKLAPLLYIQTIPIFKTTTGKYSLEMTDNSTITEYAVKMHTFDNDNLFTNLFTTNKLDLNTFKILAQNLASHHLSTALTSEAISAYGNPENIKSILNGNFSIVENYVDKTISPQLFRQIKQESYHKHKENIEHYTQRVKVGKIRENHGDIHLRNICVYKNKVQIFDCIEFNEQFKNIDCIYDVAFLFMDLIYNGHKPFAYTFLNEYLEQSGDYEALSLLPLYASMRAFIRGKVISIETNDQHISEIQRNSSVKRAGKYFELANHFLQQKKGKIIIVSGVSGSGKSTLSQTLSLKMEAIHLRSDAIRKHLANTPLYKKSNIYTDEITQRTYAKLSKLAIQAALSGYNVIVDATFLKKDTRKNLVSLLQKKRLNYHWLWCTAATPILEERIKHRAHDISDANIEVLHHQLKNLQTPDVSNLYEVDTSKPDYVERLAPVLGFI